MLTSRKTSIRKEMKKKGINKTIKYIFGGVVAALIVAVGFYVYYCYKYYYIWEDNKENYLAKYNSQLSDWEFTGIISDILPPSSLIISGRSKHTPDILSVEIIYPLDINRVSLSADSSIEFINLSFVDQLQVKTLQIGDSVKKISGETKLVFEGDTLDFHAK